MGLHGAAGVPVKTVVADSVWQALATGNFNAVALSFGEKLSDKVEPAHKHGIICGGSGLVVDIISLLSLKYQKSFAYS